MNQIHSIILHHGEMGQEIGLTIKGKSEWKHKINMIQTDYLDYFIGNIMTNLKLAPQMWTE